MVFGDFVDNNSPRDEASRLQALRAANCIKILGKGVIRVVHRVDDARENNTLDLSDCQLMQVPDAVYYMMRNTTLVSCNLSSNVITKIPPKFPAKFSLITELNLSHNRLSTLPDEISECTQLEKVDISHNSFISIPQALFSLPALTKLNARKNFIADIDVEVLLNNTSSTLENVNLEDNPLNRDCQEKLSNIDSIRITMTPRELEEWEDLSI
jgi:Leucine-rich repeat (LRR) protein